MEKNNTSKLSIGDIHIGIATLIKEMGISDTLNFPHANKHCFILDKSMSKKIVGVGIRKIVFETNGTEQQEGKDLFYRGYTYRMLEHPNLEQGYKNNTIMIANSHGLYYLLKYAGFEDFIDGSDLSKIRKTLLSKDKVLRIQAHNVALTREGIIDQECVDDINNQASSLLGFIKTDLPTRPQKVEKILAKNKYLK